MKTRSELKSKESVGERITSRLKGLVRALEDDAVSIPDQFTCKTVTLDLETGTFDSEGVLATRRLLGASQAIFAQFLGVSANTVRSWEQGTKTPMDMACRFLDEIRRNPEYWRARLRESVRVRGGGASR